VKEIDAPDNLKNLTGMDLGNLWYVLDSCSALYFADAKTLSNAPSTAQLDVELALDSTTHEYISRLEGAILRLPAKERSDALEDLKKVQRRVDGPPLWAPSVPVP
jgi:hypothetical protein